jgi:hypothetical protein
LAFFSKTVRRITRPFKLLRAVYAHELVLSFKQLALAFVPIFAAVGFFIILWGIFLPVVIYGFNPRMPRGSAVEVLKGIAAADLAMMAADFGLVGVHMYVGRKRTGVGNREPSRRREVGRAASLTFLSLVASFISVYASMSYLDEYVTRATLVWPLLFMLSGIVGILYLLSLSADVIEKQAGDEMIE